MFVHIILVRFKLLSGQQLTRLTICFLCILTIRSFGFFPFGFEGWICVLITPVPGHCILIITLFFQMNERSHFTFSVHDLRFNCFKVCCIHDTAM